MSEIKRHPEGSFCRFELATTDVEGAKAFYGGLFGWAHEDFPLAGGQRYTMFKLRGSKVATLSPMSPEQTEADVPPHWGVYAAVEDADASAERAVQAGGTLIVPPFDVVEGGRIAVIADRMGAVFSLWQPGEYSGVGIINEPGAKNWVELISPDIEESIEFYGLLFGWTAERKERSAGGPYVYFSNRGAPVAGLMTPPIPEQSPAWIVYFEVTDCNAAASKCGELGGTVESAPRDVPDVGRFAYLSDPRKAPFAILQPLQRG